MFSLLFPSRIQSFYANNSTRLLNREMQKAFRLQWAIFLAIQNINVNSNPGPGILRDIKAYSGINEAY